MFFLAFLPVGACAISKRKCSRNCSTARSNGSNRTIGARKHYAAFHRDQNLGGKREPAQRTAITRPCESAVLVFYAAVLTGFEAAAVDAGQRAGYLVGDDGEVTRVNQQVGYGPDVFFVGHPVLRVEAREVNGDGIGAQGSLAAQVEVVLKIA